MKNSPANKVTVHKFTNIYFLRHPYSYSTVWIMKICYGVTAHITHFRFLPISPLIFATVQKFALDYLRDQQILTPPCEWGWVVVVPLLGTTLEVEDSPGMVCFHISPHIVPLWGSNHFADLHQTDDKTTGDWMSTPPTTTTNFILAFLNTWLLLSMKTIHCYLHQ